MAIWGLQNVLNHERRFRHLLLLPYWNRKDIFNWLTFSFIKTLRIQPILNDYTIFCQTNVPWKIHRGICFWAWQKILIICVAVSQKDAYMSILAFHKYYIIDFEWWPLGRGPSFVLLVKRRKIGFGSQLRSSTLSFLIADTGNCQRFWNFLANNQLRTHCFQIFVLIFSYMNNTSLIVT